MIYTPNAPTMSGNAGVSTGRGSNLGLLLLLTALSAGLLLAGCKKENSTGTAADGTKKLKLASIIIQQDDFFRLVQAGMRDAAKKADAELLEGLSNHRPEKEIELVNTYIARKVDAVLISPLSRTGSVTALKAANDKGIKVVAFNTLVDADFVAASIECSPADLGEQTGKAARQFIETKLGGKAKIAIVAFRSEVPEQSDARTGAFKAQVTQLPGVQVVAEQDAWLPEMSVKKTTDILTAHPDVDIVYGANEGGTTGAVLAVKNAGKAGKVHVFGTDVSDQLLQMLQADDEILQAVTAQRPVEIGQRAVEAAIKSLKGQAVEKRTVLPGILLSREDQAAVKAYQKEYQGWIAGMK